MAEAVTGHPNEEDEKMSHVVTKAEALLVLPILQAHAASLLEQAGSPESKLVASMLRAGRAGGNAIEGTNQNFDHDNDSRWPSELDTFWRVLCVYEEVALDGHMQRGGGVSPLRGTPEQPNAWMLHEAARVLRTHVAAVQPLVEAYEAVAVPAYNRI